MTHLARIRGSLLGGAVGDALGAGVEFFSLSRIRARFGPGGLTSYVPAYGRLGAITDDTQMTLFTAEGLIRAHQRMRKKGSSHLTSVIHKAYLRWLDTQGVHPEEDWVLDGWLVDVPEMRQRRAPGATCVSALSSGVMGTADHPINDSKGCGGVTRIAPIGLVMSDPFELAAEAAAITHGHPTGYLSAGSLAVMLRELVTGHTLAGAVGAGRDALEDRAGASETITALDAAGRLAELGSPTPARVESLGGGWVGEEALAIAVYCALVATDFDHGITLAANHSGDSDSTASIAGQLLGAVLGIEAISGRWLEPLELRVEIEQLAGDLHKGVVLGEALDWRRYPGS